MCAAHLMCMRDGCMAAGAAASVSPSPRGEHPVCGEACRGLADLRAGIIRTPLPPKETFMDGEDLALWSPGGQLSFVLPEALPCHAAHMPRMCWA